METHSLKHSVLCAVALPRNNPCSSDQPCCQVIDDVTVKVWHHQHVELVRVLDQLQRQDTDVDDDFGYQAEMESLPCQSMII